MQDIDPLSMTIIGITTLSVLLVGLLMLRESVLLSDKDSR